MSNHLLSVNGCECHSRIWALFSLSHVNSYSAKFLNIHLDMEWLDL